MDPLHPIIPTSPSITAPVAAPNAGRVSPDAERRREQARQEQRRRERERERGGEYADLDVRDDDQDGGDHRPRIDITA